MARARFHRQPAAQRRASLIEATQKALAEHGFAGASVRVICAMAGVSPGLLTHYFDGVDHLIVETYKHIGDNIAKAADETLAAAGPDPVTRLKAYIGVTFKPPLLDRDLLAVWVVFWSLVRSNDAIRQTHDDIYSHFRGQMEGLLIDALGDRAATLNTRLTTVALNALMDGLWLELCLDNPSFTADEAHLAALDWVDRLLG